ncbi:MAG TPA: flavodoxin [Sphaerochaeta sp.]|nr:flavodoxin [Sphaerochaeta sp.]
MIFQSFPNEARVAKALPWFVRQRVPGMSKELDCPTIRLHLKKEFSSTNKFLKYFWTGKSAVFHEKPALANEPIDLSPYDTLIIATPVWAGNVSSPVRSFLAAYVIEGKQVYLVAHDSGGSPKKCFATMRALLPKSKLKKEIGFVNVTQETYSTHKEKLEAFCKEILAGK